MDLLREIASAYETSAADDEYITELPAEGCQTTFFFPSEVTDFTPVVDTDALKFLPDSLRELAPTHVLPVRVGGDGNCLLRAVSYAIWGRESHFRSLRNELIWELNENRDWYIEASKDSMEEAEWADVLLLAQQPNAYLESAHIFALANVVKRVIVLYASDDKLHVLGGGEGGVAATFLPSRVPLEEWQDCPLLPIMWSNEHLNHFIPLIGLENKNVAWPHMPVAYKQDRLFPTLNLQDVLRCTNRKAPSRVTELRNSRVLGTGSSPQSQYRFVERNGMISVLNSSLSSPKGQVFFNQRLIPVDTSGGLLRMGMRTTLGNWFADNQVPHHATYMARLRDYFLVLSDTEEYRRRTYNQKVGRKEDYVVLPRYGTSEHLPAGGLEIFGVTKVSRASKKFEENRQKRSTPLTSSQQQKLREISTYLDQYLSNSSSVQPLTPDVLSVWFRLLNEFLKCETEDVFPIVDILRVLVQLPQVPEYVATHCLTVSDPENILAAVLPHVRFLNQNNCKQLMTLLLRLIMNLASWDVTRDVITLYAVPFMMVLDKCITEFNVQFHAIHLLCAKVMVALAKVLSHEQQVEVSHATKIRLIHVGLKYLSLYHLLSARAEQQEVCAEISYQVLRCFGTLFYHDNYLQHKILLTHIRWPIQEILDATQEYPTPPEGVKDASSKLAKTREIALEIMDMLSTIPVVLRKDQVELERQYK